MMLDDLCTCLRQGKQILLPLTEKANVPNFLALAAQAEKFDFGELPLETDPKEPNAFSIPKLTADEREWWFTGLIPLPAPICWYEFSLNNIVSGILIRKDETGKVWVMRNEVRFMDDVWVSWLPDGGFEFEADAIALENIERVSKEKIGRIWASNGPIVAYLTLMINSKTSDILREIPSGYANRLRRLRHKTPLSPHTRVVIVPTRYLAEANGEAKPGSPKRLHWRRSHLRILHRDTPRERKIVVARHLVGKRELGEIIHDCYEVRMKV